MDGTSPPNLSAEASSILAELTAARTSAQQAVSQIDALGESGKQRLQSLSDSASSAVALVEAIQARLSEAVNAASSATSARTKIADDQAVIATKSEHIQAALEHADKVRKELDRLQTALSQQATEAEALRDKAKSANESATEALTAIRTAKAAVDADALAVATAVESAKADSKATKGLAERAESIEEKLAAYEKSLRALEAQAKTQLETIVGLLPGATAAGLAHAFDDRRKNFLQPARRWQWLFVGSVVALVILALTGLWNVYRTGQPLSYDELARLWLARLPIAAALIWLALHASREAALAKRLEEDYGYKAAVSASFQGFHKQMEKIAENAPAGSPLATLCTDTLATIASPPGRIYDKHQLIVSPAGEVGAAAAKMTEAAKPTK
jgi:chaperonin cofactor prefoldin